DAEPVLIAAQQVLITAVLNNLVRSRVECVIPQVLVHSAVPQQPGRARASRTRTSPKPLLLRSLPENLDRGLECSRTGGRGTARNCLNPPVFGVNGCGCCDRCGCRSSLFRLR